MPKIIQWMVRMDGYLFTPNKQLLLTIRIVFIFIYFYFFIFFWTAKILMNLVYFCAILGTLQITQFIHNFLNSYSFFYPRLTSPSLSPLARSPAPLEALKKIT
jgi:hypothetical protein